MGIINSSSINGFERKFILSVLISFFILNFTFAQSRKSLDIHRIKVTCSYVFENGKKTTNYWANKQDITDSLGRLHTEVFYGLKDHYPHLVLSHFFNGKTKIRTEKYIDKLLKNIEEYTYNRDSILIEKNIKSVSPGDTALYVTIKYKYVPNGKPIKIEAISPDKKRGYTAIFKYDLKGTETSRIVKVKKDLIPEDSILNLKRVPTYDSLGRLRFEKTTLTKYNKTREVREFKYSYDNKNNITEKTELDEKGGQIRREERTYQTNRNRISEVRVYDNKNILIEDTEFRYELYRTKDLRNREIEY